MDLKAHPTLPGVFVTPDGRVFQELFPAKGQGGYHHIKTGKTHVRRHTVVAETYIGPRPFPGAHVRHLDGDPGNDVPGNLAWGTAKQNGQDTIAHGRSTRGQRNARAILTREQAQEAWDRRKAGESAASIALDLGVSAACIHDITKGRSWPEINRGA